MQTDDSLSGNWFESTHRIGGSVSGRNTGRKINARAERDTFTAPRPVRREGAVETNWALPTQTYSDFLRSVRIHSELILPSTNSL